MSTDEVVYSSATALAHAIRAKHISAEEVVTAYLARLGAVNPALNAVVEVNPEAHAQARRADEALLRGQRLGPLHGLPITVKEAFAVTGMRSTGGTLGRKTFVAEQDATAVARLRAAGAIILGTTNTPELSLSFESDNLVYGRTNNPYDLTRTPGGSTGGEAAIIAAGGSPLGLAGDYAGSTRVPAHFCGIAGLRPTVGRVSRTGYFPPMGAVRGLLAQPGPLARYVADLALMLPVISGADGHDHSVVPMPVTTSAPIDLTGVRVAYYTDNGILPATAETVATIKTAAQVLADAGATIMEDQPVGIAQTLELFLGLLACDGGAGVQRTLQLAGTATPHPATQAFLKAIQPMAKSAAEFISLWFRWDMWRNAMLEFMQQYDLLLCPVSATPAMAHGTAGSALPAFSYAMTYTLTASPVVVVRAGTSADGLPIGVQIVPHHWREEMALGAAQAIETALGGWQRPPL